MFVDRFSDDEAVQVAKKFCSKVETPRKTYNVESQISKEDMERGEGFIKFFVEYFSHELDCIELNDFSFNDGFSVFCQDESKQKEYRKFMYRRFGKEYLDAIDTHYRKPIIDKFNARIAQHEAMLDELVES